MSQKRAPRVPTRLLIVSVVLGLFVLLDLGLFGWLIFRSLSEQEVERVLMETRQEAEGLAQRLAGRAEREGEDLYTVTAMEKEIQTYIDSILKQRQVLQSVEVRDREGKLVFRGTGETTLELEPDEGPRIVTGEVPPPIEHKPITREGTYAIDLPIESLYDLDVPIGDFGFLHVGISQEEMQKRTEALRTELVRKSSLVGLITIVVLVLAYLVIWWLWKRGQRLKEKADEAERLAYIGTLASGLAHEIRNPLNSLNLNMQLLDEEMGSSVRNGSSRRLMAITRDEIARLERLVTDFLSYAKSRPLELEVVPSVNLLERCRELMAAEIQARGAQVRIEDSSSEARVNVDPELMNQLFLNLMQNALVATEETGRKPIVLLSVTRVGDQVVFEVRDRGMGIPAGDMGKIFDLFFSTRKGGTGLGLAVVQRIAQAHDGRVEVQSSEGKGTAVRVVLPAAKVEDRGVTERSVKLSRVAQS